MFKLRRLYFDSIGVNENRFTDLTIDLTDAHGNATDSICLSVNGSGKTTALSLLLALIRPARREFLAYKTQNRTLEDLILGGDTAHVVAEWVAPDGRPLLTGAVYEWDGRSRPGDHNGKGKERLKRSWWCITPPDPDETAFGSDGDGATLETLPFTLRTRGAFDRERFCSHITGLAAKGIDARVVHQNIAQWHDALREHNFDTELFEYFLSVNSAEGGIDKLFNGIDSPDKFVRYLLKFVANPHHIRPVRDLLQANVAEIAKRPMYLAEKAFCEEAQSWVQRLGYASEERATRPAHR